MSLYYYGLRKYCTNEHAVRTFGELEILDIPKRNIPVYNQPQYQHTAYAIINHITNFYVVNSKDVLFWRAILQVENGT